MKRRAIDRGFDVALAATALSDAPRAGLRMGSALYAGARLLSVGANRWYSTHPDSDNREFNRTVHAEHVAILKRRYTNQSGLTLYVARIRADGSYGCSKPCGNCMNLMKLAGVTRVRYFDHEGKQVEINV
jgi:deoxycytidylate deaminase